jgi:hypothetical protein|tara:strand:+ start:1387 stop:1560 length:174 start_codon:yes stop_codon:yes gene_type:complete
MIFQEGPNAQVSTFKKLFLRIFKKLSLRSPGTNSEAAGNAVACAGCPNKVKNYFFLL